MAFFPGGGGKQAHYFENPQGLASLDFLTFGMGDVMSRHL